MLPQKTALNQSSPSILDYSFPHHYFQNKAQHIVSNAWWLFKRGDNSRSSFVRIARRWLRPLDRGCHLVRFITGRLRYQPPFRTVSARIAVALVVFIKTPINHIFFKSLIIPDYGFELTKTIYLNVFRNWNALCKRTRLL